MWHMQSRRSLFFQEQLFPKLHEFPITPFPSVQLIVVFIKEV